jgi:hypothetical protein
MIHVLVTILIVCLVVFLIEKFLGPGEPWRTIFRVLALCIAVIALLSLVMKGPIIF